MHILVHAIERLRRVLAHHPAIPRPRRIDKHQVRRVQQAVLVLHHRIRRALLVLRIRSHHPPRPKAPHMQIHRRRTRPAVIQKRHRPHFPRRHTLLRVVRIEHPRRRRRILRLVLLRSLHPRIRQHPPIEAERRILRIGRAHHQHPRRRLVSNRLPTHMHHPLRPRIPLRRSHPCPTRIRLRSPLHHHLLFLLPAILAVLRKHRSSRYQQQRRHRQTNTRLIQSRPRQAIHLALIQYPKYSYILLTTLCS